MAVLVEGISVIVRVDRINDTYPGGWESFVFDCPNSTLCADSNIARVGFLDPDDVDSFCKQLEKYGLVSQREGKAIDFVVVDQLQGLTVDCDWLKVGHVEIDGNSVAAARLSGCEVNIIDKPEGWEFEGSLSATPNFVPCESVDEDLIFLRKEGDLEVFLHKKTGKEVFRGRITKD